MLKICAICKKGALAGRSITRKGLAKKKGGTGKKIARKTARTFSANLQKMRVLINNRPQKIYICTRCIKKGLVQRA